MHLTFYFCKGKWINKRYCLLQIFKPRKKKKTHFTVTHQFIPNLRVSELG
jgi:hypothetical protein